MSKIIVVDDNDNEIGVKERNELSPTDIYRVSVLWMTNHKGDVLMAERAFTKKHSPGKWGPAVAGTVEAGENYDENIVKEVFEELGLHVLIQDLKKGPKRKVKGEFNDYFSQWYFYTADIPTESFTIAADEVAQVKWFVFNELKDLIEKEPEKFIQSAGQWIELFSGNK
jgi:isopentenyl-diphosphate delta-isomerase